MSEPSLWEERLQAGLRECLRAWSPYESPEGLLRGAGLVANAYNRDLVHKLFDPEGESEGLSVILEGFWLGISADPRMDLDVLRLRCGEQKRLVYLSNLPDAAHEIYVALRADGVSVENARSGALLLDTVPST